MFCRLKIKDVNLDYNKFPMISLQNTNLFNEYYKQSLLIDKLFLPQFELNDE